MPPALHALAVVASAIGSTEFVVLKDAGLLAASYASIAMAAVALLIAAFALHPQPAIADAKAK
jgi:hypothetical protein